MSGSFHCPSCSHESTQTTDSRRSLDPVQNVRRRRRCVACGHRFTTREILQDLDVSALIDLSELDAVARTAVRHLVTALSGRSS